MAVKKYTTKKGTFYEANVYLGKNPYTGKQVRPRKKGFKTRAEAQKWHDVTRAEGIEKYLGMRVPREKMKVQDLYDEWLDEYIVTVRPSTYNKTTGLFRNHILPVIGDIYVTKITRNHIQRMINTWPEKFKNYSMMIGYVKRLFKYAAQEGIVERNPCEYLVTPRALKKPKKKGVEYYDEQEIERFLAAAADCDDKMAYPLFRTFIYSGMRRQEILALTWQDIDFKNGIIDINKALTFDYDNSVIVGSTKNETSTRLIAMDQETMQALKDWRAISPSAFKKDAKVFDCSINRPWRLMQKLAENAGIDKTSPHKLRHTHCTIAIDAGANPKDVQDRLGHKYIEPTLNIYAHSHKDLHRVVNLFSAYVSKKDQHCTNDVTNDIKKA